MFRLRFLVAFSAVPVGARSSSTESYSLVRGHARTMTLIALSLAGLLVSAALLYARSKTGTTTLLVTVREEELVRIQGESVILKIRLASDVTAKLWGDTACGAPGQEAMVLTKSGTYTISLGSISQDKSGYVCLLSSDGTLRDSLPIK